MITITRSLARQFRALLRKARLGKIAGQPDALLSITTGDDGLRLRVAGADVAIEYHRPGSFQSENFLLPVDLLADVEGRSADPVTLELGRRGDVNVSWTDRGVPQLVAQANCRPPKHLAWPELPSSCTANPPELWQALRQAVATSDQESSRYALHCLQLRGQRGQVVATDGRHIYAHRGFELPWSDDLLVPANSVLGCRELASGEDVGVGQAGHWISLRLGCWTVSLKIDREGRFPQVDDCMPSAEAATSRLIVAPADAQFLQRALPSLPDDELANHLVTLDLNGCVIVRSRSAQRPRPTELLLTQSRLEGEPVVLNTDRRYLARAIDLGFREIHFRGNSAPATCQDERRQYVWALLDPDGACQAGDDPLRIESPAEPAKQPSITQRRRNHTVTKPNDQPAPTEPATAGKPSRRRRTHGDPPTAAAGPIEQAVALHTALRQAAEQTKELVRALKRQQRQSRLVESTLNSLKQLQDVA